MEVLATLKSHTAHTPGSESGKRPDRRFVYCMVAVLVPALVYGGIILARYDGMPYLRGDCQYYYYTALSLWYDHDLDLENQLPPPLERHSDDVSLDRDGRLVPKHPIWFSIVSLPLIVSFGAPGALAVNLVQILLLLYLACRYASRFAARPAAATAVLLTGVTSFLPHYVWNFSPDIFTSLLLMAGLLALPADRTPKRARHFVAGLLLGLAAVTKFSLLLALLAIPLLCGRPLRRTLPALAAGLAVPVILSAILNAHLFGSPFVSSYDRIATIEHKSIVVHSQRSDFDLPLRTGAWRQLTDRKRGLMFTTPVTLVSLIGLYFLARRNRLVFFYLTATFLAFFIFFSKYRWWWASFHGNRFLMPIVVLATVPLAVLIDSTTRSLQGRRGRTKIASGEASPDPPPVGEQGHEEPG